MEYRWNLADINKKKKYITERLKNHIDPKEKEKLQITLISYVCMLNASGSLRYTGISNLLDRITKGKYSLDKNKEYVEMEQNLVNNSTDYINEEYLTQLIQTSRNLTVSEIEGEPIFNQLNLSEEQIVNISKSFYEEVGNQDINENALKQLNSPNRINFYTTTKIGQEEYNGMHFSDLIFGGSYCAVKQTGTIYDVQALNHEIMHSVDSSINEKTISDNYYGFHEVPAYTIDYLMFDYLEKNGFTPEEVKKLREKRNLSMQNMASLSLTKIYSRLLHTKGLKSASEFNVKDIMECITMQEMKWLLEVQSYVMAYGLSLQVFNNKEQGIANLNQFMKSNISKDNIPNFSHIGLSQETILQLSKDLGQQILLSNNIEKVESNKNL